MGINKYVFLYDDEKNKKREKNFNDYILKVRKEIENNLVKLRDKIWKKILDQGLILIKYTDTINNNKNNKNNDIIDENKKQIKFRLDIFESKNNKNNNNNNNNNNKRKNGIWGSDIKYKDPLEYKSILLSSEFTDTEEKLQKDEEIFRSNLVGSSKNNNNNKTTNSNNGYSNNDNGNNNNNNNNNKPKKPAVKYSDEWILEKCNLLSELNRIDIATRSDNISSTFFDGHNMRNRILEYLFNESLTDMELQEPFLQLLGTNGFELSGEFIQNRQKIIQKCNKFYKNLLQREQDRNQLKISKKSRNSNNNPHGMFKINTQPL